MTNLLEKEIWEQPNAVERLLTSETLQARRIAAELTGSFDNVLIVARGSSDNVARYATYLFGTHNRLPVALAVPSLFTLYNSPPQLRRTLVIGISQSGRSPDIVQVVEEARRQGQPTLAIVNDPQSSLARSAEYLISLRCGPELAVAATKSYTSSLAAVAMLSAALAGDDQMLDQIGAVPGWMQATLSTCSAIIEKWENSAQIAYGVVIGRGYNYATAFEIALKIKELSGVVAEPYSPADFRHGPIAMIKPGFPAILVAPTGQAAEDMRDLHAALLKSGAACILISDRPEQFSASKIAFPLPQGVPEWLSPLLAVIPGQIIAQKLAISRGLDPNAPVGLTKVTHTW